MNRSFTKFHKFNCKLLKSIDSTISITAEAKDIINELIYIIAKRYAVTSSQLCNYSKKVTLDHNAIKTLTKIWILNNDCNILIDYCYTIWEIYANNNIKGITKHARAGIYLPPSRIKTIVLNYLLKGQQLGETFYIFLAIIINNIISQLLQLCIKLAKKDNKYIINGDYIYQSITSNEMKNYKQLFNNIFVCGFGYVNI